MLISLFSRNSVYRIPPFGRAWVGFGGFVGFYALITALTTNQRCWRIVVNVP